MRGGTLRISSAGLRGVVGNGLTAAQVLDFASAFGTFLERGKPIVLGRDPRASGVMMRQGVIASLLGCGHDVIDLGLVSTPVIQHAITRLDAAGGVSIGASHNNAEWNALKFFGSRGTYLSTPESAELLDIYHLRKFDRADWTGIGKLHEQDDAIDFYVHDLSRVYDFSRIARYKVLVDCCNGTSAPILRRINERFGTKFLLLNERLQGASFAHEPAITPDIVSLQLAPLMEPIGADAGFLFDIDSDRVGLATEKGQPASEEILLPLVSDYLLPKSSGKLVITNLSTTSLVEEVAKRAGGEVVRVPVGRQAAIDALSIYAPEQIALAGEGSGAVMMPQFRFVYDGIAAMLAVLMHRDERQKALSSIVDAYPKFEICKGQVPLRSQRVPALFRELDGRYLGGHRDTRDGLRVDWPDRWFHIRVSQTEPIVRVICEQRDAPPKELFQELMDLVRSFA